MANILYSAVGNAWDVWTTQITTSCSTDAIYTLWCGSTASTSTTANVTWSSWNSTSIYTVPTVARAETPEVIAAREELSREYARERKVEQARQLAAEERAEKLLLENLDARQQTEWKEKQHFTVYGRSGRRYRIRRGRNGNIDVIDRAGAVEHRLCAHPNQWVPDPDTNLAQKLMLESDDEGFARIANRHASFDRHTPVLEALH